MATTVAYTLSEFFAFFGSHPCPSLPHSISPMPAPAWPAAKSAEQDLAQRQDSERLPEGDGSPSEDRRRQPIPQTHQDESEDGDCHDRDDHEFQSSHYPSCFHIFTLMTL
jgi:hypothetical protein